MRLKQACKVTNIKIFINPFPFSFYDKLFSVSIVETYILFMYFNAMPPKQKD